MFLASLSIESAELKSMLLQLALFATVLGLLLAALSGCVGRRATGVIAVGRFVQIKGNISKYGPPDTLINTAIK